MAGFDCNEAACSVGSTADLTDEPIVRGEAWARLRQLVVRRVVGLSVSRCSAPNREEDQGHGHRGAMNKLGSTGLPPCSSYRRGQDMVTDD